MISDYKLKKFKSLISDELLQDILEGGKIIDSFFMDSQNSGMVVVEYGKPRHDKNGMDYHFAAFHSYESKNISSRFYKATEYTKQRRKTIISKALTNFFER